MKTRQLVLILTALLMGAMLSSCFKGECTVHCSCDYGSSYSTSTMTFGEEMSRGDCAATSEAYQDSYCDCSYDWQ